MTGAPSRVAHDRSMRRGKEAPCPHLSRTVGQQTAERDPDASNGGWSLRPRRISLRRSDDDRKPTVGHHDPASPVPFRTLNVRVKSGPTTPTGDAPGWRQGVPPRGSRTALAPNPARSESYAASAGSR